MSVSEIWNQIFRYMEIVQWAWKYCHIVFGEFLTVYRNKVVKPLNGPSGILDLIAIGYRVVDDATGYYGFGINGSLVSTWS